MARILRSAGLSGLRFLAFRLSERGSRAEPDQTLHDVDVDEIGEADGADEEPHPVLRLSEDMLDAGTNPGSGGVGLRGALRHRQPSGLPG